MQGRVGVCRVGWVVHLLENNLIPEASVRTGIICELDDGRFIELSRGAFRLAEDRRCEDADHHAGQVRCRRVQVPGALTRNHRWLRTASSTHQRQNPKSFDLGF